MGQPNLDQDSFGWFEDDNAAVDSCTQIGSTNNNPSAIKLDYNYNMRFLVQNTGDKNEDSDIYQLWYRVNTGGGFGAWTLVSTTSSYVRIVASANWSDGATTGQVIGAGTNQAANADSNGTMNAISLTLGQEVEWVWNIQFRSADLSASHVVELEVRYDTPLDLDSYTNTPSATNFAAPLTVTVNALTLAGSAPSSLVVRPVLMDALTLASSPQAMFVSRHVVMDALTLVGSPVAVTIYRKQLMSTLTLVSSAESALVVRPVLVNTLTLASSPVAMFVSRHIVMDALVLTASPQQLIVLPVIMMATLTLVATAETPAIFSGGLAPVYRQVYQVRGSPLPLDLLNI